MPSALDPNRLDTLRHRLDVRLAARKVGRAERKASAEAGWRKRRGLRHDGNAAQAHGAATPA